jgi:hypothetical protein
MILDFDICPDNCSTSAVLTIEQKKAVSELFKLKKNKPSNIFKEIEDILILNPDLLKKEKKDLINLIQNYTTATNESNKNLVLIKYLLS